MPRTAVKSTAYETASGNRHPPGCRNCGTLVSDKYCPHCGQSIHDHAKSVFHLFEEVLEGFLHFDSRMVQTIKVLFVAPGRMTADYNEGKRAAYVPPVRLYLFVSVLFFVTLAMTRVGLVAIAWRAPDSVGADGNLAKVAVTVDEPSSVDLERPAVAGESANEHDLSRGDSVGSSVRALKAIPDFRFFVDLGQWHKDDREAAEQMIKIADKTDAPRWIIRIVHGIATGAERPDDFNHLFSNHLSKVILLMMPIFALMLAAVYWRQQRYFVEHVTLSLHFHSFIFVVLFLLTVAQKLAGMPLTGHPEAAAWLLGGFGVYLLFSMKRVYGQGWIRTPVKFLLVSVTYFVLLAVCFTLVLMWSLPGVS